MRKAIELDKDKVIDLVNQGCTRPYIAKQLGIGTTKLANFLKANNLRTKGHCTDFSGKRFGKLTVIEKIGYSENYKSIYLCKCDCGNTKITRGNHLRTGSTISCGCDKGVPQYKKTVYNRNLLKIGEKYGRLTIIDVKYNEELKQYQMICKCDCGNISVTEYSKIKNGETVSCGCYRRELSSKIQSSTSYLKNRWYFIKDNEKVYCRSSYEVFYANYLILNNIDFEYEPEVFKLAEGKRYTPDFYIKNEDLYIEIKGIRYDILDKGNQQEKFNMFKNIKNIEIYHWKDLVRECELPYKTYKSFKYHADKMNISIEEYLAKMLYI